MQLPLTAFTMYLSSEACAPRTIQTYNAIIAAFDTSWQSRPGKGTTPTRTDVETFLGRSRKDGTPRAAATRNQELATLRVFSAFARRDLGWENDPTEKIPFVREPPRARTVLTADELQRSFHALSTGLRPQDRACNLAILALLSQAGLRVHELVKLDLDQVDLVTETLLRVEGKGGTAREIPLNERALLLLLDWIKERPKHALPGERALIVSSRGTRISIRTVERRIQRLREIMQLAKKATPHSFRHTFATLALLAGTDLAILAELLGHSDINTTALYLHCLDTRRREAVRKLAYTVPPEVLPVSPQADEPVPTPTTDPLPKTPEPLASPPPILLDDQQGLDDAA
ncbi:MAG: tyrosine-type recombinase/integrase, partial [Candidatus Hydrogenedentes bacterium]|nr:tyrosine-type recombinase/integrase [Candidatus Hydrogenedentota bacterium]